ncbi:Ca2+:H+ antiporter [Arthrobacter stackebrandtii]|uniref:Ca2+:H+ antiporter n=1 Tax=Arthrobacter stackebrandtii TaxID=272161 RepID=A0ABS4Z1H0_9MICC|nr:calcium:proton antiporter [Arthrobacter stackebrandtii]MBP2414814.1 Ca2+:H+ antiporter [Arthrobacter stackebrandtii]PYG99473.1 calcium:proton antiporter [Arthrobacter stackebrandtii]
MVSQTARSIFTRTAIMRIIVGWGAVAALMLAAPLLEPPVPTPLLATALAAIIAVILLCSFGVVHEAEHLARRLGDPYGSLVLTLSIVLIEVVLISAVMLGPGEHATIARDSVFAVSMIILNGVIGLSLLLGGLRHGGLRHNRTGTSAYFAMIIVLASLAFALPALIGTGGSYTTGQESPIILLSMGLYAFFLVRQMGAQAGDFTEVDPRLPAAAATSDAGTASGAQVPAQRRPITEILAEHRAEVLLRLGVLVVTVLPIVLLSHDMAALLDDGLGRAGAPVALSGILIAMIVFLPETITTIRAALAGEAQRVSNLCHGALVSTVGLTIPAVLLIGLFTGQAVTLAESPANLLLLGVTLLLSITTFASKKATAMHGAAHLAVFAVYGLVVFS